MFTMAKMSQPAAKASCEGTPVKMFCWTPMTAKTMAIAPNVDT